MHQALITRFLQEGWQTVRAVIEMRWLTGSEVALPEPLLTYEAAADAIFTFQHRPSVALLQYDAAAHPGELVVELLKLHPIAIIGTRLKRNPYYVSGDDFFGGPAGVREPRRPVGPTRSLAAAARPPVSPGR
jgi:hypothetical protein